MKALLQLQLWQSLCYNPIVVLLLVYILTLVVLFFIGKRGRRSVYKWEIAVSIGFLSLWFIFFITRNILLKTYGIDMLGDFIG